jgi:serine/threonine protein kinase
VRVQPGRILGEAYRVERALGAGGVGAVYEATQIRTGRRYAVKVLLPEIAMKEGAAARFRREAEALAAIGHTGIVQIHDFDTEDDGTQFLVMDLLEGEDLAARITRAGALPAPEAVRVLGEIGSALSAAHALGIVHRDLKPANIFLSRRPGAPERATILDFGLAKNLAGPSVHLTATGVGLGTPLYMSPEQARGDEVDLRSDVYSLGCILFEMLTGTAPFTGPSISVVIAKILTEEPPLVSERTNRPTPPALDEVVRMALAKSPADRYATVQALVEAAHRAAATSSSGASDRALAETALGVTPSDARLSPPGLPLTRDALPLERPHESAIASRTPTSGAGPAVPSIRPARGTGASTTDASDRPPPPTTATSAPPWMWAALGVLGTLALVGVFAIGRELGAREEGPRETVVVRTTEAAQTAPSSEAPAIEARAIEAPAIEAPAIEAPAIEAPAIGAPTAERRDPDAAQSVTETATAVGEVPVLAVADRPRARRTSEPATTTSTPTEVTAPVAAAPAAPPPPPTSLAALTPEQRAYVASQSAAAVRAYDAQITANDRRVHDYEAALPDVLELRRQARAISRGTMPAACSGALRQRLDAASRGDESLVASVSTMLEGALDPVCTAFESWAAPPSEIVTQLADVTRELERGERMLDEAPRDAPAEDLETVRRALAAVRRMHEAQPASHARYPCRGPEMAELEQASQVPNGWARAAADRPRRVLERACTAMGMTDRRLSQLAQQLSDRTDAAEQQLRQGIQIYSDMSVRLRAARAQMLAQSGTP